MKTYQAESQNPTYTGKTLGIRFNDGKAIFNDGTIDKALGRKASEIAKQLKDDFSVKVKVIDGKDEATKAA